MSGETLALSNEFLPSSQRKLEVLFNSRMAGHPFCSGFGLDELQAKVKIKVDDQPFGC